MISAQQGCAVKINSSDFCADFWLYEATLRCALRSQFNGLSLGLTTEICSCPSKALAGRSLTRRSSETSCCFVGSDVGETFRGNARDLTVAFCCATHTNTSTRETTERKADYKTRKIQRTKLITELRRCGLSRVPQDILDFSRVAGKSSVTRAGIETGLVVRHTERGQRLENIVMRSMMNRPNDMATGLSIRRQLLTSMKGLASLSRHVGTPSHPPLQCPEGLSATCLHSDPTQTFP